jgi:hypothetical protein
LRLEQQLVNLDAEWRRRARRIGGVPEARADRAQTNVLYAIASVFALVAVVASIASRKGPVLGVAFGGIALLIGGIGLAVSRAMARARAQHEADRVAVLKRMQALRGVRVEPKVRVEDGASVDHELIEEEDEEEGASAAATRARP